MVAINHGITILSWLTNLTDEEMPPRWSWHLTDELERHFEAVKANRGAGPDNDDSPSGAMLKNEYAQGRGRNLG